jgi:hypothetical protein
MSYNGSGTFVINSTGQPVVTGTVISSTAFNALTADLATGLSTALTKDGQTTPTANLPMGTFKFTGLSAGSAATDSANIAQVQNSFGSFLTVSGTDTITATVSPSLTAYASGQMFAFVAANTNTGAVTINISTLGAKAITKNGNTALSAGDLTANYLFVIVYDGTQFQVVGVSATTFTNLTISGVLTLSGAGTQLVSTGTGAWQPPAGTTGQRPASPSAGAQRWNSTLLVYEIYNGIAWVSVASQTYAVDYLVVAGGGGGGGGTGGGGGAGGMLPSTAILTSGTAYTVTVGAGGAGGPGTVSGNQGTIGSNSVFTGIATATGGGSGGGIALSGGNGGSGGGGGGNTAITNTNGGTGTSGQGFAGGTNTIAANYGGGGGGGASAVGGNSGTSVSGNGGAGLANSISGSSLTYAGGGGGGANSTGTAAGTGGAGGGGAGGFSAVGTAGTANTGGGGGAGGFNTPGATYYAGGTGGSGQVVISYASTSQRGTGGTVTNVGGFYIHTFSTSGTYTA